MMDTVEIRDVKVRDANEILGIYEPYVLESAITFEYEVPSVAQFTKRIQSIIQEYPYYVACLNGKIVGYAYASTFKDRSAYQWCAEVSVYLAPSAKGKGIAKRLYDALEEALGALGVSNVYACIAYPNEASIRFHEKQGFTCIGYFHKCGYKLNQWWDMVWMEKIIKVYETAPVAWKKER